MLSTGKPYFFRDALRGREGKPCAHWMLSAQRGVAGRGGEERGTYGPVRLLR